MLPRANGKTFLKIVGILILALSILALSLNLANFILMMLFYLNDVDLGPEFVPVLLYTVFDMGVQIFGIICGIIAILKCGSLEDKDLILCKKLSIYMIVFFIISCIGGLVFNFSLIYLYYPVLPVLFMLGVNANQRGKEIAEEIESDKI
ncbi:hypothetical protein [Anaerofustis sp.]|uniref:hypothetical protein n=1 Tax=Anaerofustis sp. TaxID=1872517 RepID=UPI0025BD39C1|nr:hypothetical protein [Anaerofustis sp.]